ncbi:DNA recombination protein RmuC [Patescibacteria group bacterium]|nr:DNA recombination protein RmuC [Patescibacteria group bacterium]
MLNTFLIVGILLAGFASLFFFVATKFKELKTPNDEKSMDIMLKLITELRRDVESSGGKSREELEKKLNQITQMMRDQQVDTKRDLQNQFKQSAAIIQEVTKDLTHLKETNKQVVGFAEQMKSLENILKNPKQRGILGEYALETLLSNTLPGNYEMQYKMKNGEIVDAAIFFNNLIIPIDAKFSLEKYNMMMEENDKIRRDQLDKEFKADVKRRIDETAKYIRPSEGTTEFAFMFIPAEGVYYNLTIYNVGGVNTQGLIEYAFSKRVILVSPSSFFAYLQTVIQGLKALEMGENVQKTLKGIEVLGKHVHAYDDYFKKLGKHLETTVNTYNLASSELKKIDKDVYKLTDRESGGEIDTLLIERPIREEV